MPKPLKIAENSQKEAGRNRHFLLLKPFSVSKEWQLIENNFIMKIAVLTYWLSKAISWDMPGSFFHWLFIWIGKPSL